MVRTRGSSPQCWEFDSPRRLSSAKQSPDLSRGSDTRFVSNKLARTRRVRKDTKAPGYEAEVRIPSAVVHFSRRIDLATCGDATGRLVVLSGRLSNREFREDLKALYQGERA